MCQNLFRLITYYASTCIVTIPMFSKNVAINPPLNLFYEIHPPYNLNRLNYFLFIIFILRT